MSTPTRYVDLETLLRRLRRFVSREPNHWFSYDELAKLINCNRDEAAFIMGFHVGKSELGYFFTLRINPETKEYEIKAVTE